MTVVPLRTSLPLTRVQPVTRSDEYVIRQGRLRGSKRGQLLNLEARLKASGVLDDLAEGFIQSPPKAGMKTSTYHEFRDRLGMIIYTYSCVLETWMLLDFDLNNLESGEDFGPDGAGGSLPAIRRINRFGQVGMAAHKTEASLAALERVGCLKRARSRLEERMDRLMAAMAAMAAMVTAFEIVRAIEKISLMVCERLAVLKSPTPFETMPSWPVDHLEAVRTYELNPPVTDYLRQRCDRAVFSKSVIGDKLLSVHQVQNPFARKILFGEYVFRAFKAAGSFSEACDMPVHDLDYKARYNVTWQGDDAFVSETKDILLGVSLPDYQKRGSGFTHYKIANMFDGDRLSDDRVLHVLRLEFISKMAEALYRKNYCRSIIVDDVWCEANEWMTSRLVKDLSAFGELVSLSSAYFAAGEMNAASLDGFFHENRERIKAGRKAEVKDTFRHLTCLNGKLGMAKDLSDCLGLDPVTEEEPVELRDKMIGLVEQLLLAPDLPRDGTPSIQ